MAVNTPWRTCPSTWHGWQHPSHRVIDMPDGFENRCVGHMSPVALEEARPAECPAEVQVTAAGISLSDPPALCAVATLHRAPQALIMNRKLLLALLLGSLLACATITRAEDAEVDDDDEEDDVEERAYLLVRRKGERPPVMGAVRPEQPGPDPAHLRPPKSQQSCPIAAPAAAAPPDTCPPAL